MKAHEKYILKEKLQLVSDRYVYLLDAFQVPSSKSDDFVCSDYLLEEGKKYEPEEKAEHETRLKVMQNKIKSKYLQRKRKSSSVKNISREKLKKDRKKKVQLSAHIQPTAKIETTKKIEKVEPFYNSMKKLLFSKVQIDENDVVKKGTETDTKKLLRKALEEKKSLNALKSKGDSSTYSEAKNKKAWDRAIAKTLGQKMKDDIGLLSANIQKRKKQVMKSKQEWAQRTQKVEHMKTTKQKQRMENIKSRAEKKKNKKKQKLVKKGRIIPGF
ncbi:surfeit locus protein 6 homolog [Sabethes cyaneus]|uniref:surfeit locus protein 6 homolog n=1 Tax=Sabethes cyaneus TaxID=53552 RepID=UPI00237E747C|nr:surfeit locus protein 6 homolog [Sabethes cyaneus]